LAEVLAVNTSLTELVLAGNDIDETAGIAIASALHKNHSLRSLDLSASNLGPNGLKHLSDALVVNKSLTYLSLMTSAIDSASVKVLAQALKQRTIGIDINLCANPVNKQVLDDIELPCFCRMIFQKSDLES
jgi:Ran GTPase-activating protein (RanGAP) involved in mRNA processing and transport